MNRFFDIFFAATGILVLLPVGIVVYILGLFDTGSPIFVQERMGRFMKPFKLYKFRTMDVGTKSVASHLAKESQITKMGGFLRKTKIDELPQLINVLIGDMSLVGPRPNLFNQKELIDERKKRNIYDSLPGITGLAQINDIDMSEPKLLAETDQKMLKEIAVSDYFKYIIKTVTGKGQGDRIRK